MAATTKQKNCMIAAMEAALEEGITEAGIANLGDLESQVDTLRTNFNANPASVTDQNLFDVSEMLKACFSRSYTNIRRFFTNLEST